MNLNKYLTFTIILFLLCITNTYAACTQEEIKEFKKIEDNYKITYKFNKMLNAYDLTLHLPNIKHHPYGYEIDPNIDATANYVDVTETSLVLSDVQPGEYVIKVVGTTLECDNALKVINLKLSKYNSYSEDPLCNGIEEFVLCQTTYDKDIDYETFVSRVNTYKKSKASELSKEPQEEAVENKIFEYIKDNIFQIIVIVVFIILLIITIIVTAKSIRKSRRLE